MITIGEFALSTGVSVKALRFYDERGLLTPAEVDPHSGYRRYRAAQMRTATTIRILRTAGFSVEDVKKALQEPDRLADLLQAHAAELDRRRDLEDRAMTLGHNLLQDRSHPDGGQSPQQDIVRFRTAEAVRWVAVVHRLHLDANDLSEAEAQTDAAEEHLEALAAALVEAGVPITGPSWAGLEPVGGSSTVIDMRLALPVGGEVPPSFTVAGLNIETGVLPLREEAYVEMTMVGDGPDLLGDAPGGPLPPDELITLAEVLEERGIEYGELRQRGLTQTEEGGQDPVYTMEAAVTVRVLK
ncbi:MerR family transcriptional regulator [Micrococcus sp. IITD107]|uniref:MerR family transcriptional regulator n=1 Tax=Micrococcus sp. IITD107 TaxID=3342790 RepID=UPI0035B9DE38